MIHMNPIGKGQVKRRRELDEICRNTKKDLLNKLASIKQLDGTTLIRLEASLSQYSNKVVNTVKNHIVSGIKTSIGTTIGYYSREFTNKTGYEIPEFELKKLGKEVFRKYLPNPFMGSSFENRIARLGKRLQINVRNRLQSAIGQSGPKIVALIYPCFFSTTPIEGGSLIGGAMTLLVSEENRAYHEAALEFFNLIGIRYVRFCLTPEHNIEDICDTIAAYVDPIIKDKVDNPEGIYRIEDLPKAPHPRAYYYLEPIYELGFTVPDGALKIKKNKEE